MIVTLVNKRKTIDEKRRDLLRHVKPSFCDDAKAVACMYSREILIIIIVIIIPILTFEVSYCRVLHEMEFKHSDNWLFWIGETSSTDGLKGEGFIS